MAQPAVKTIPQSVEAWGNQFFEIEGEWSATLQKGGINNQVYLCTSKHKKVIAKTYPIKTTLLLDRFQAERDFLEYAARCAGDYVPGLLSIDSDRRILVMDFLDGTRFENQHIPREEEVRRAANFLACLTTDLKHAREHITSRAAEGYLALTDHIENVSQRIEEMTVAHLPSSHRQRATSLLKHMQSLFETEQANAIQGINSGEIEDSVSEAMLCPSPSDFGFHNAIACTSGVKFFDFEFAGWDDPAKTVCDFFLQPRICVPTEYQDLFEKSVASVMPLEMLRSRIRYLRPILRLKWGTIILAVLRPQRLNSLLTINPELSTEALIRERLDRAERYLIDGVPDGIR